MVGHDHGLPGGDRSADRRALSIALALTAVYTVAEVLGGVLTGSLALLADAGHMLSDNVSIALALFAVWIAAKPPTPERTFGFSDRKMGVNYGLNRVRFTAPLPSGSRVRARFTLQKFEKLADGGVQVTWNTVVEREGADKPVLVAEWLGRHYY